ncbi:hypothetical protein ACQ4PT_062357 [Festuca glaucescens]
MKDMPLDKCPGPDGFSARFFVVCWDIIKEDIMTTFNPLSRLDCRGFGAVNEALITLLHKKDGAEEVRDFRSISLIHGFAKLVAKVLANRVAPVLPQMVGVQQSAFVRGRCLHDNFMMVQGTARKLHSSSTPVVLLKLDITKAFDTVEWSFLIEVLRRLGFGERVLACICALLSTASTRVLLNGTPGSRIANRRGLRQGDPLSPQLFILIMEILHLMIEKASSEGLLTPLAASGLRHRTSIYAADVVTFLCPSVLDFKVFSAIIQDFGAASGLHTNMDKCSANLIHCSSADEEVVARELRVDVKLPAIEVRYNNLYVEAECRITEGIHLPTLWNSTKGVYSGDKMDAVAYGQQAYRFNSELRIGEVYVIRGVGFQMAELPPQSGLSIPTDYYVVMHSRTQIHYPEPNVSIPRLPSQFMEFHDAARLRNKQLTDVIGIVVDVSPVRFHKSFQRSTPCRDVVLMNIRQEFICLRIWDKHLSRHMMKWQRAEQEMSILAATLLEVSMAQGALKSTDESHIVFEPDNPLAVDLAAYHLKLGPTRGSILTRVRAFVRQRLVMGYYTNLWLGRL